MPENVPENIPENVRKHGSHRGLLVSVAPGVKRVICSTLPSACTLASHRGKIVLDILHAVTTAASRAGYLERTRYGGVTPPVGPNGE